MAVLFYTAGVLLIQMALFGVYAIFARGRDLASVDLAFSFLSSGAWAAAAAFVARKGLLPPGSLNTSGATLDMRGLLVIPIVAVLLVMAGSSLESLVVYAFPSLLAPDPVLSRLVGLFWRGPLEAITVIFLTVVVAPVTEEFYFRGLVFRSLRSKGYSWTAAAVFTSLLFAAVHLKPVGFVTLFVVSMTLTLLVERTGSLLASMLLHATYNAVILAIGVTQNPVLLSFEQTSSARDLINDISIFRVLPIALLFTGLLWFMLRLGFPPMNSKHSTAKYESR